MSNIPRLSKSRIEYLDYAWNFYSGCHNWKNGICQVGVNCWAKRLTERFKRNYPNGFEPTFYPEAFLSPLRLKKPSIIGCAFMGDLFGDWVDPGKKFHRSLPSGVISITTSLRGWIFTTIEQCPQHTFVFLTKCPQNLAKWSPFPKNCWVGVTATDVLSFTTATILLGDISASIKFLSIEPLLAWGDFPANEEAINQWAKGLKKYGINWLIIGALTGTKVDLLQAANKIRGGGPPLDLALTPYENRWTLQPSIEWVEEIVEAADRAGVPVFLKNNLRPIMASLIAENLRQEFPASQIDCAK